MSMYTHKSHKEVTHIEVYAVAVKDKSGNIWSTVVDDFSNTVQVYGVDHETYFESEAYHLQTWARENGLQYSSQTIQLPVTFEFT